MKRALILFAALSSASAGAVPFTITLTNTATTTDYDWSTGLLTLQPLIGLGLTPQPGTPDYATYVFANSDCNVSDAICGAGCNDNGNAAVLAQRRGLTLGTNAWIVPALLANGGTTTLTIDVPAGSRLSYIAWVNSTAVFDDFVAMHPPGDPSTLSVPLFTAGGTPVENIDFVVTGYDSNSTSATDGSGTTCTPACPTAATGCFVAPGNASAGAAGTFPVPPTPNVRTFTASTSATQNRLWWSNTGPHQGVVIARSTSAVTFVPTNGVAYTAGQAVGGTAATGDISPVAKNQLVDGQTFTLSDGVNPAVVFEFDTNGAITAGRTRVDISAVTSATQIADVMVAAINAIGNPLRMTATKAAAQPFVLLTDDVQSAAPNIAITETVANNNFAVNGMSGGTAPTATLVYVDNGAGAANKATDATVTAGVRYFYKTFSHANTLQYANGAVPSSTGLFSEVTSSASPSSKWCYSVGFASLQQPVTSLGVAVFTSNTSGSVTANVTTPANTGTDGNERWRPVQLGGSTQSRPLFVPTEVGDLLITGDFSGRVTAINPVTGATVWTSPVLGTRVQGQPVAQLKAYANSTFLATHSNRDLIFVGSRNTGSTTNNQVFALSSVNGTIVWTYTPGNLDYISGGMAVDYERNRLYVGAHNGLRVLNSVTGAQVASLLAGSQLDYGVNLDFGGGVASSVYTVTVGGVATGIDLATMTVKWNTTIGATSNWIFPTGNGFIAPMQAGSIRRYAVQSDGGTPLVWERTGTGIPTGATVDYANSKVYAGSVDGKLRQIDFNDGGLDKTYTVTTTAPLGVGFPTIDRTVNRLHVGTADGRICAFPIPLP